MISDSLKCLFQKEDGLKQKLEDKERGWLDKVNEMSRDHRMELEKVLQLTTTKQQAVFYPFIKGFLGKANPKFKN